MLERQRRFSEQPFGDPDRVRPIAIAARDQVAEAIKVVQRTPVDVQIAEALLRGLATTPEEKLLTYDSARQVIWALQTIVEELESARSPVDPQVAAIVRSLGQPETTGIDAQLPSGRTAFIYPEGLDRDLRLRAEFSPSRLKMQLDEISQLLVASP